MAESSKVNNILHNLRGEEYRRSQNRKGSRSHVQSLTSSHQRLPTLPAGIADIYAAKDRTARGRAVLAAGPPAPKSWIASSQKPDAQDRASPRWRIKALSLVFSHLVAPCPLENHIDSLLLSDDIFACTICPLTLLCLRRLVSKAYVDNFIEDALPHIPNHLQRVLVHDSAIHSPLPNAILQALGQVEGELIVVGPQSLTRRLLQPSDNEVIQEEEDVPSWDSPLHDERSTSPLQTFILVSSPLSMRHLLSIPSTITCLALIGLPNPIPLMKLPLLCPLLRFFDLSYNTWLADADNSNTRFEMIQWTRWKSLKFLGLRECFIDSETIVRINRGRWDDVEIIQ